MMGQYHYIVNFDKQEYIDPNKVGSGQKAWEQLANVPSTPQALFILLVCSNGRGGGDLNTPVFTEEKTIGRWAGDRIAVVGDYAEDNDIPHLAIEEPLSAIYTLCREGSYREISHLVRTILAAELGVRYFSKTRTMKHLDGTATHYEMWGYRRDSNAGFSVLD